MVLKEGGNGVQCPPSSTHSPSEPRLSPPGPGMQMSSKAGDIGVHWRWVPRPCTSRLNLKWGALRLGTQPGGAAPAEGREGTQQDWPNRSL